MLAAIDVTVDDPTVRLWRELETDRRLRTRVGSADRDAVRGSVTAQAGLEVRSADAIAQHAQTSLAARIEGVEALAARTAAALEDLERAAASLRTDLQRLDATVAGIHPLLDGIRSDVLAVRGDLGGLRQGVDLVSRDLDAIREEAAAVSGVVDRLRTDQATIDAALAEHAARMDAYERSELDLRWRTLPKPGAGSRLRRDLSVRLSEKDQRELVSASGLFDSEWYMARYPDVARSGVDPIVHYLRHGAAEGRDPGPRFDTRAYLVEHPEVARAGVNPLVHRLRDGQGDRSHEGRE
jgi:hypothetical protein